MKGIWDEILEQGANAKDKPDTTPIVDLIGPAEQPFDSPLTPELGQGTTHPATAVVPYAKNADGT